MSNVGSGATQIGTRHGDSLDATTGHDVILGKGGNDTIHGADVMTVSLALPIDGALVNAANADAVSFLVSGMPAGAALSAGQDNGNGTWSLTKVELSGLAITASNNSDFTLNVSATATDWATRTKFALSE